jgi:hypothetical protein
MSPFGVFMVFMLLSLAEASSSAFDGFQSFDLGILGVQGQLLTPIESVKSFSGIGQVAPDFDNCTTSGNVWRETTLRLNGTVPPLSSPYDNVVGIVNVATIFTSVVCLGINFGNGAKTSSQSVAKSLALISWYLTAADAVESSTAQTSLRSCRWCASIANALVIRSATLSLVSMCCVSITLVTQ